MEEKEYKLPYTAEEIKNKLKQVDDNKNDIGQLQATVNDMKNNGISAELKTALVNYYTHVMPNFDVPNGLSLINAILTALGAETRGEDDSGSGEETPTEKTLSSISATYTGGNVAVGTALTDLTGITVTATYSDGSTANVTGYTLSGTIAEGSNTITVSYGGKTTTFIVTGVSESGGETTSPFDGTWVEGIYLADGKENTGDAWKDWMATNYVSTDGYENVVVENDTGKLFQVLVNFYDDSKTYIGSGGGYVQGSTAHPSPLIVEIPDGTAYVRISTKNRSGSESAGWVYYTELKYYME